MTYPLSINIFLDTEFTDFNDRHLISLGMVADTGQELYLEVPYPEASCSDFVREVVLPLLRQIPDVQCNRIGLRARILGFLESVRPAGGDVVVCVDFEGDWELIVDALNYRVPPWCERKLIWHEINDRLAEEFFENTGLPKHHALYDARANRYAHATSIVPDVELQTRLAKQIMQEDWEILQKLAK